MATEHHTPSQSMKLTIKHGEPWAATLSTLTKLERTITTGEANAMEARWLFGRELLSHRKEYKGRHVIPADLMKLASEKCGRNKVEINWRIRFALKFATKTVMLHACNDYPSWRQMITVGLVEKKAAPSKRKASHNTHAGPWVIRRLSQEVDRAYTTHASLSRDQVKDIEQLLTKLQALLNRIDQNDAAKSAAAS